MVTRTVSVPEPEYSIKGHASATITHAAAHKAHILLYSGTQNLSSELYKKIQNYQITDRVV